MVAAITTITAGASVAVADPLTDDKIEKADKLFQEGRALLPSNQQQACAKFDESLRYNAAAIGTILNVALCEEKAGHVASATARFTEARDRAKEQGLPQHMQAAEEHIATLAPQVPHLAIKLAETLPSTTVLVDDRVIGADELAHVAVDPGERTVVVNAPDRLPYRTRVVIGKAEHKDVAVPALARSVTVTSSRRRIGQITTIAGVAAAGTGLGLGLYARHRYNQQFDDTFERDGVQVTHCTKSKTGPDRCDASGQNETSRARTLGNVGTIVGVAGLVATGVGVYLWLRAPRSTTDREARISVVPEVSPDAVGVVALGRF